MSIPPPPPALLKLTRKAVSLLGNNTNKPIVWQLPQCIINGQYNNLLNCIAIQNNAISVVVWFYLPPNGTGALLSFQQYPYLTGPGGYDSLIYVGTDGYLHAYDSFANGVLGNISAPISPGWHMAVVEEYHISSTNTWCIAFYVDGSFIGRSCQTNAPTQIFENGAFPYGYIGVGYTHGLPGGGSGWSFFNGVFAYIALYSRVLGNSDVMSIYQGNRVTNGLVAEYSGDTYSTSNGVWVDDVGNNNAKPMQYAPEVIDFITTEFTSGINYDLLAQKIAEKISGKPISIANLPINQYGNLNIGVLDSAGYPYIDINAINNSPLKNWFKVLSNASITSNGSSSNYSTGPYKNFLVTVYVGSVSGTSPSLTVYFNAYDSNSGQSIPLASATLTSAGATYMLVQDFPGNYFNISWVVGGTSPSFGSVFISVYESW